jgi:hypothetical protein
VEKVMETETVSVIMAFGMLTVMGTGKAVVAGMGTAKATRSKGPQVEALPEATGSGRKGRSKWVAISRFSTKVSGLCLRRATS